MSVATLILMPRTREARLAAKNGCAGGNSTTSGVRSGIHWFLHHWQPRAPQSHPG